MGVAKIRNSARTRIQALNITRNLSIQKIQVDQKRLHNTRYQRYLDESILHYFALTRKLEM